MRGIRGLGILAVLFGSLALVAIYLYGPRTAHSDHEVPAETGEVWTCGMHPQIRRNEPGRCPICGMDLSLASDTDAIRIDSGIAARLGIATSVVAETTFGGEIRSVGRIDPAQDRIVQVQTRMMGWVEILHAAAEGDPVRAGEPLFEIYSPEITAVEEEYRIALEARRRLGDSPDPDARARAGSLAEGALERLRRLAVPEDEIARLVATGRAERSFSVRSPIDGYVSELDVRQGVQVAAGQTLYSLVDLDEVWLIAQVYESEMEGVEEGMPAVATVRQVPGRNFRGRVDYVYPSLDRATRTNRIRIVLANRDGALRPGMFGDVRLARAAETALVVPIDAVIRTGTRDVVYVETSPGAFEPREVHLGAQRGERYVVLHGLAKGDRVVSRGAFFLDSEASLRETVSRGEPAGHAGHAGMK